MSRCRGRKASQLYDPAVDRRQRRLPKVRRPAYRGPRASLAAMSSPTTPASNVVLCGSWEGERAFVVPQLRRTPLKGVTVSVVLAVVLALLVLVAEGPMKVLCALGLVFFGYTATVNFKSLRRGAAWYLTPSRLVVQDGGGTLAVEWAHVRGFTPVRSNAHPGTVIGLGVDLSSNAVTAKGAARRWLPLSNSMGVPMLLRPQSHVGGPAVLEPLLQWCLTKENRPAIGAPDGLARFEEEFGSA